MIRPRLCLRRCINVIGNWMILFAVKVAATAAAKIVSAFEWPGQPPRIAASAPSCNTWFLGPTRVFIQHSILIGSAVFAQLTVECPITLQWAAIFSPKIALSLGVIDVARCLCCVVWMYLSLSSIYNAATCGRWSAAVTELLFMSSSFAENIHVVCVWWRTVWIDPTWKKRQ